MEINSKTDGINHINVYSKGITPLGRWLSNFTFNPIITEDGYFASIEGYWYWLGCKNDKLRRLYGFKAKQVGRELGANDWLETEEFKDKIRKAIKIKIQGNKKFQKLLKESTLPLVHYYEYKNKKVNVPQADWIIEEIIKIREELKCTYN